MSNKLELQRAFAMIQNEVVKQGMDKGLLDSVMDDHLSDVVLNDTGKWTIVGVGSLTNNNGERIKREEPKND
jgi:hypothetical protein